MAYVQCLNGHSGHAYDQSPQIGDRQTMLYSFIVYSQWWFGAQDRLPAPPAAPRLAVLGSTLAAVAEHRPALARLVHLAATPAQQASDAILQA